MKRIISAFIFAGLIALPVMAQEGGDFPPPAPATVPAPATGQTGASPAPIMGTQSLNFSSARPQFIYFSLGVPIAYSLDEEEVVAGRNFGVGFTVIDNMTIGYDHISSGSFSLNLLRVGFLFHDMFGAAIGFGGGNDGIGGGGLAVSLGAFANIFQNRSSLGFTYALGLRMDYLALADRFEDGAISFTIGATFGL